MKNRIPLLITLLLLSLVFAGCRITQPSEKEYDKPLPLGQNALRKLAPSEIPDFSLACLDLSDLKVAVDNSIHYLNKSSSKNFFPSGQISHAHVLDSLKEFKRLLESNMSISQLNASIKAKFDVYMSVGCDDQGTVLFTGYYTPIFDGSFVRTEKYKYPLYKIPDDLVKGSNGEILGQRGSDGRIRSPYPSRKEIESTGMLKGNELVWLSDPFEVYIAHVQGSAKIRLPNGDLTTVGYAANNGHEYHGISQELVKDNRIPADQISLASMISYFQRNPAHIDLYVSKNPRFVFFRKEEGPPMGSLNEPVIAMRSIATDKTIFPRGALTMISTTLPKVVNGSVVNKYYNGFALDQDTGGAIRAPGRCDVYMGQGDIAGKMAGQTYQEGKLYYLFLKPGI